MKWPIISISAFATFLIGAAAALIFLRFLPSLPVLPDAPIAQTFDVHKPVVMGFLPYWLLSKTQPESLSHLNRLTYFGLTLAGDGTLVIHTSPQETEPGWLALDKGKWQAKVAELSKNTFDTSLLIHLSNEASISALLADPPTHAVTMINQAEPLMKQYHFVDLNLDIESFKTASPATREAMSTFLRSTKAELQKRQLGTLTTELTVSSLIKDQLLDPIVVGQVSDRVVLMAYDFHYRDSYISGSVAPIGGAKIKTEYDVNQSISLATQSIPPHKLILGIPLYGYEWESLSASPEAAVIPGTGKTATLTRVQDLQQNCASCSAGRDALSDTPYIIAPPNSESAYQQIFYEDQQSLKSKLELAKQYNLGGIAFWAMGYENPNTLEVVKEYQ